MIEKMAVVAVGGNSLIEDPKQPQLTYQWDAVRKTCRQVAEMVADGWAVILTHGNGPQAGFILRRVELASEQVHTVPLDVIVADTQGSIGYMLQQAMDNSLRRLGINRTCATVVSQIRVDQDDPAFENPNKPIGGFMTKEQADAFVKESGLPVMQDAAGRGWRRVVASPRPRYIQEINAIQALMLSGYVVITAGGGGIPVVRNEVGSIRGIEAVIDKDRASSLLAQTLRADLLMISTTVEKVALNFNTPHQVDLDEITLSETRQYLAEGHFGEGSMLPKVEAALEFVERGGPRAIITDPANLRRALRRETGTHIIPGRQEDFDGD